MLSSFVRWAGMAESVGRSRSYRGFRDLDRSITSRRQQRAAERNSRASARAEFRHSVAAPEILDADAKVREQSRVPARDEPLST